MFPRLPISTLAAATISSINAKTTSVTLNGETFPIEEGDKMPYKYGEGFVKFVGVDIRAKDDIVFVYEVVEKDTDTMVFLSPFESGESLAILLDTAGITKKVNTNEKLFKQVANIAREWINSALEAPGDWMLWVEWDRDSLEIKRISNDS